mmetsp:Transcript_75721/g.119562  ORF Transcript_75721/g.119562 Transcript_75721/m.119562 type:complete len:260 (-) Transcript_75721:1079-1858(-)
MERKEKRARKASAEEKQKAKVLMMNPTNKLIHREKILRKSRAKQLERAAKRENPKKGKVKARLGKRLKCKRTIGRVKPKKKARAGRTDGSLSRMSGRASITRRMSRSPIPEGSGETLIVIGSLVDRSGMTITVKTKSGRKRNMLHGMTSIRRRPHLREKRLKAMRTNLRPPRQQRPRRSRTSPKLTLPPLLPLHPLILFHQLLQRRVRRLRVHDRQKRKRSLNRFKRRRSPKDLQLHLQNLRRQSCCWNRRNQRRLTRN